MSGTLSEQETVALIELMFFAYRDFVSDPDEILDQFGFGRAHHRVLHFVGRDPGMTVQQLLDILRITKQSLGRVLKELIDKGYVFQKEGESDRRQRLLYLTEEGEELRQRLMAPQMERIRRAVAQPGATPPSFTARCSTTWSARKTATRARLDRRAGPWTGKPTRVDELPAYPGG